MAIVVVKIAVTTAPMMQDGVVASWTHRAVWCHQPTLALYPIYNMQIDLMTF